MKKPIVYIIVGIIVILAAAGLVFLIRQWNKPLGASFELPTRTPMPEISPSPAASTPTQSQSSTEKSLPTNTPTSLPSPTEPQPVCGGPPVMYILGIGADNEYNGYMYGLADVIRIARVDFVNTKVTVLTVPRDLWVEFPGIIEKYAETVTHGKLNQAYFYGGPGEGYYEGEGGGPGLLAHTIAHNFGLYVDHYAAVHMTAFEGIVDALGGIDIYLEQDWDGTPVDDITDDMGYFEAGQHHMSGEEALRFARIRKRYSVVDRSNNQTLVICAIKDKMLSPSVVSSIPKMIQSLIGTINTDLTLNQISQLTCLLPKLGKEDLVFIRFPDEMLVPGRVYDPNLGNTTFIYDIPKEDIQAFLEDFANDAIPIESGDGMTCP